MCTLTCMSMHGSRGRALMNNLLKRGKIIDLICYKKGDSTCENLRVHLHWAHIHIENIEISPYH